MKNCVEKDILDTIEKHKSMVADLELNGVEAVAASARLIIESLEAGSCIFICGNGGSAADAQHIAGELVGRFRRERKAFAAIALSTDTSIITAIGNDYSFDNIFERQVEALVGRGDVLWAISTSGNSSNVVLAAKLAKSKGAKILAFTGKAASRLEKVADVCFCAEADETFHSQQIHQIAYHIICDLVEKSFC